MCGISGYISTASRFSDARIVQRMCRAIAHRGPDDEGITLINRQTREAIDVRTTDTDRGVISTVADADTEFHHSIALGHRRFSIIDLSAAGHQPFWTADRAVCVAFNGEIYNYVELRQELAACGREFRTSSDTEVLAVAYLEWGTEAFARIVGFWALSLYDATRGQLLLSRDRLGKASLFVGRQNGTLWWSSEIKGIAAGAGSEILDVREQGVVDFLARDLRDVNEQTLFSKLVTFPKASYAWVNPDSSYEPVRYWSLPSRRMEAREVSPAEAASGLRERMAESLRLRLRADVPVGFELSGGLDSSSLFAVASSRGENINAFTIAFPGTDADEIDFARRISGRYPSSHLTIVEHAAEDFFDRADEFVGLMDEPLHSPNVMSIQNIWRRMREAGKRVTVSGNAGDELFAGYPGVYHRRYLLDLLIRGRLSKLHRECRLHSERPAKPSSLLYWRRMASLLNEAGKIYGGPVRNRFANLSKLRGIRSAGYLGSEPPISLPPALFDKLLANNITEWRMNYWLRISNIASLGIPIEIRSPYLDHNVVEYVFQLPREYLIRDGWLKWILRYSMNDYLPRDVVWRTNKQGFPFPYAQWLQSSRERFFAAIRGTENPFFNFKTLESEYGRLARLDPLLLWRVISVCLWWRKTIEGRTI